MAPNGFPYCEYCEVGATGGDGSLWGWENEQSCVVVYGHCKEKGSGSNNNNQPKTTTTTKNNNNNQPKTTTTNKKPAPTSDIAPNGYPYCVNCVVTATGGDGSLWGWENEKSCVVDYDYCNKKNEPEPEPEPETTTCFSVNLGFKCCSGCNVIYTDNDGDWGVENDQWCGIPDECKSNQCWSEKLGYQCCKSTKDIVFTDNDGNWGIENGNWCGLI
ncbi:hypothetical protein BCR32DRAFT_206393 [Anaeromyces robustus]|uniref:CBM10 domain-containing protein n=1 Tax=Anaeromyces robustus TaxID=1754192 RepID=A0A1Y1WZP9_9FUNG|nr:hypothetical protein BCR32DRAFT_206393 [Anaeromyces robustus]|eukprot:ORX78865.1 hypothetical protein BCR32DRAFT_206393 [Anaeromyces robustus]